MDDKAEIYSLSNPLTGEIFYIGSTKRGIKNRESNGWHFSNTVNTLKSLDVKPIISIIEVVDRKERLIREKFWVQHYVSSGITLDNVIYNPKRDASIKFGRPSVAEKRVVHTVSILTSVHQRIVKRYGSLTKFIDAMILKENI